MILMQAQGERFLPFALEPFALCRVLLIHSSIAIILRLGLDF
jgi:hypothetical protein